MTKCTITLEDREDDNLSVEVSFDREIKKEDEWTPAVVWGMEIAGVVSRGHALEKLNRRLDEEN